MRTTLNISDALMRQLKNTAAQSGRTMTAVVEQALRDSLTPPANAAQRKYRLKWQPVEGRLQPGVDLSDRDALYDRMEGRS